MIVLLTGATGFIGSAVLVKLASHHDFVPRAVFRRRQYSFPSSVDIVQVGDLNLRTDWQGALQSTDVVIHTAGRAHVMEEHASDPLKAFRETNTAGTLNLARQAVSAGVKRINISLDSLKADRFLQLTRTGNLDTVLNGIESAVAAGFKRIKLNAVILKGRNDDEIIDLVNYAREKEIDISFIEEMPLGNISSHDRGESYCSSDEILEIISQTYTLTSSSESTGGPSKYYTMADSNSRIGFISPHSHNFCGDCNRVRVTVEGRLLLCLGNEHSVDLKGVLREYPGDLTKLKQVIVDAMDLKPERHYFDNNADPQILRFMNTTGG